MSKELILVCYCGYTVVYLDGKNVFYSSNTIPINLFEVLGYKITYLQEIPAYLPPEFYSGPKAVTFNPPEELQTLQKQFLAYNMRITREAIDDILSNLAKQNKKLSDLYRTMSELQTQVSQQSLEELNGTEPSLRAFSDYHRI